MLAKTRKTIIVESVSAVEETDMEETPSTLSPNNSEFIT